MLKYFIPSRGSLTAPYSIILDIIGNYERISLKFSEVGLITAVCGISKIFLQIGLDQWRKASNCKNTPRRLVSTMFLFIIIIHMELPCNMYIHPLSSRLKRNSLHILGCWSHKCSTCTYHQPTQMPTPLKVNIALCNTIG